MASAITAKDVQRAALELRRMRSSLTAWLKYRALNDRVRSAAAQAPLQTATIAFRSFRGQAPATPVARQLVPRDMNVEQELATRLHALLEVIMKGQTLPDADLHRNPDGAVQLAQLALTGSPSVSGPVATGALGMGPWLWPVLIVGGLLLTVTTAIKTAADVAKDREEKACIMAGACTDYGMWLKAGALLVAGWFAWNRMGLREAVTRKGRP